MALPAYQGRLESSTNRVLPEDTATWDDLDSWQDLSTWISQPSPEIIWRTDRIDLGRSGSFNLEIITQAQGIVSYRVYTSTTGAFNGEETETVIANNATNIAAFTGRYVIVAVYVTRTSGLHQLESIEVSANTETFTISRSGVDSATLAGTTAARELDLGREVSHIWSISIQAQPTVYNQDVYVTDYPSANTLIPTVISRTPSAPTFKLVGLDNVARDAVIDFEVVCMATQTMLNGNLVTR
jgi:hypothetical protein